MKYTVVWKPAAEAELARLWMSARDRSEFAAAANSVENLLKHDPHAQGESRSAGTRLLILPLVAIRFTISDTDRLVTVLSVHSASRHEK
jgi:mRNA-degrading endonuclease RelE of RelBE toxin-antitoxin system